MYYDDDVSFESPLATFTRNYTSTESRQSKAWKGWLKVLEFQYDRDKCQQALDDLDYAFFGCDIVFLASALGGANVFNQISPYVAWHQLQRDDNMAESVETRNSDYNNLDFPNEPSFWVWYFGCHHKHPEEQRDDVDYCLQQLLKNGSLSMTHRLPSYSFGHDITLRTTLLAWGFEIKRGTIYNDILSTPVGPEEAADIVLAHCINGEQFNSALNDSDKQAIEHLMRTVDYSAPYILSEHFKGVLGTQLDELPLGVVAAGVLIRKWNCKAETLDHLLEHYPQIFSQHLEVLYDICIREGVLKDHFNKGTPAQRIFRDQANFDIAASVAPLLQKSVREFNLSSQHKSYVAKMLETCAGNISLTSMFSENETGVVLQNIFDIFSARKDHNGHIMLENVDTWWNNPQGWPQSLQWFDPQAREKVQHLMAPVVDAGVFLSNYKPAQYRQDDETEKNQGQAAQFTLNLFSATRWDETPRKLKM